jgi:hypothetical protein
MKSRIWNWCGWPGCSPMPKPGGRDPDAHDTTCDLGHEGLAAELGLLRKDSGEAARRFGR